MQNAVAHNHVEAVRLEHRSEKIHLKKKYVLNPIAFAESLAKLQRIQTNVCAENTSPPLHPEEITQLTRAASDFQYSGAMRNLLIQQTRKESFGCLLSEGGVGIQIIVVGERGLLVKRFHGLCHIGP